MDQDSFRDLISKGGPGTASSSSTSRSKGKVKPSRGSLFAAATQKPKASTSAEGSAFKPRTVKTAKAGAYRDRASERRTGDGNDYAQVEAVLEEFEKQHANEDQEAVERQRKYLGGDSDHSILVKGLDMALFEQNKARLQAVQGAEDDETLEEAFTQSTVPTSSTKKRTREDVIREIKEKRMAGGGGATMTTTTETSVDLAKSSGKFKPIGFKPVGGGEEKKRKKVGGEGDELKKKRKKKRKVDPTAAAIPSADGARRDVDMEVQPVEDAAMSQQPANPEPTTKADPKPPVEEPMEDEGDIFAGLGEYDVFAGLGGDDSDDSDVDEQPKLKSKPAEETSRSPLRRANWFDDEPEEGAAQSANSKPPAPVDEKRHSPGAEHKRDHNHDMDDSQSEEDEQPVRLQPLHSSAVPSIKDLLDTDSKSVKKRRPKKKKGKKKDGEGESE